jgi:hypothetical protein
MESPRVLYEINARVWLEELSRRQGKSLTLADVGGEELERLEARGVELVWLMGVWQVGKGAVEKARTHPDLAREYRHILSDFSEEDVIGSPYSVAEYTVDQRLGGTQALVAFRRNLQKRGIRLILDFVSNHTGIDHRWVTQRPEFFVQGDEEDLKREPGNYFKVQTPGGPVVLAHGRDPYFPGWTDTAQLNFFHRGAREGFEKILHTISDQCDGVRCDMAMLALDGVFRRVWGERALRTAGSTPASGEFWHDAIQSIRQRHPHFIFLAEAYWGLEGELQAQGFDFTYDKSLYDQLRHGDARGIRANLESDLGYQSRSVRFIENHDEARAASAFSWPRQQAAAVVTLTVPGLALLHDGQLEGRRVKLPVQLRRAPPEDGDPAVRSCYEVLLRVVKEPVLRRGRWRLLPIRQAWDGNATSENFLAYEWEGRGGDLRLITVNFGTTQGQCYVEVGRPGFQGEEVELVDLLGEVRYLRSGDELCLKGLYLDLPSFGYHVFRVDS